MRTLAIMLSSVALLLVIFWEEVKAYTMSTLGVLGICASCTKEPEVKKSAGGAAIIEKLIVNTGQAPPVDEGTPNNATCEVFTNHTASIPHLYANQTANQLVGTVMAISQPEYNAYGTWKKMQRVGVQMDNPNLKMYAYREPYLYDTNVSLRTREGCQTYPDVRNTGPSGYLGREREMPFVSPISNHTYLNLVFNLSADLSSDQASYTTYQIQIAGHHNNLQYRLNGGGWQSTSLKTYEDYNARSVNYTEIGAFNSGKDFVIDFTKDGGATVDRYKVYRNSAGGHFSITSTFVREQDGHVFVHTFQGDKFTPMTLGAFGYKTWGNFFDLGFLSGGDHYFPLRGETGYILDDAIVVMV